MDYQEIHQALRDVGLTWASAADAIGCAPSNLMAVAKGATKGGAKSRPVAHRLALLIDKSVIEIFPAIPEYAEPDPMAMRRASVEAARRRLEAAGTPPLDLKSA